LAGCIWPWPKMQYPVQILYPGLRLRERVPPGVTSQVLKPKEALERVDQVLEKYHYIKVVAVAGPGEPLFNEETFETLRMVGEK